jgi:alkylhydroperoxidase/carboxymuconolactone decarboxylase family protein YurZ
MASPGPSIQQRRAEALSYETKSIPQMDPRVRELVMLSALAALGCGLAAAQGDLLFVALFGAASVVAIIEAIRRLR